MYDKNNTMINLLSRKIIKVSKNTILENNKNIKILNNEQYNVSNVVNDYKNIKKNEYFICNISVG